MPKRPPIFDAVIRAVVLLVAVTTLNAQEFDRSQARELAEGLGGSRIDGTANIRLRILGDPRLANLGISLELVHALDVDPYGRPRSRWSVPGLQAWVGPTGRRGWQAKLPGAPSLLWANAAGKTVVRGFGISALPTEGWSIETPSGATWQFHDGVPSGIDSQKYGPQTLTTRGAWIESIGPKKTAGRSSPWLVASYDESGRLCRLSVEGSGTHLFRWLADGQIQEWIKPDASSVRFGYRDGLLVQIDGATQSTGEWAWAENAGWNRGDTYWTSPVHLAADRFNRYEVTMTSRGIRITRYPNGRPTMVETTFNMLTGRLELWDGQVRRIYVTRQSSRPSETDRTARSFPP